MHYKYVQICALNNDYIIEINFIEDKRGIISWKLKVEILYSIIENEEEINTENIEIISHYYKYDFCPIKHISKTYFMENILEIADLYRKINNDNK